MADKGETAAEAANTQDEDDESKLQIDEEQPDKSLEFDTSLDTSAEISNKEAEANWPGVQRCKKCGFTTDVASLLQVHTCLPRSASRTLPPSSPDVNPATLPKVPIPIQKAPYTGVNGIGNDKTDTEKDISVSGATEEQKLLKCITDDSEIDKTLSKDMTILTTIVKRIDENTFSCSTCNVNLPFPGFVKHWVCHVKEYPFICYSCSKKFRFEDEIQRHIKASNGKLRYGLIGFKHAKSVLQSLRIGGQISKRGVYVRVPVRPKTPTCAPNATTANSTTAAIAVSSKSTISNTSISSPFISPMTLLSVGPDGTVTGFQQLKQPMTQLLGQANMQVNNRPCIPVFPVSLLSSAVTSALMPPVNQMLINTTCPPSPAIMTVPSSTVVNTTTPSTSDTSMTHGTPPNTIPNNSVTMTNDAMPTSTTAEPSTEVKTNIDSSEADQKAEADTALQSSKEPSDTTDNVEVDPKPVTEPKKNVEIETDKNIFKNDLPVDKLRKFDRDSYINRIQNVAKYAEKVSTDSDTFTKIKDMDEKSEENQDLSKNEKIYDHQKLNSPDKQEDNTTGKLETPNDISNDSKIDEENHTIIKDLMEEIVSSVESKFDDQTDKTETTPDNDTMAADPVKTPDAKLTSQLDNDVNNSILGLLNSVSDCDEMFTKKQTESDTTSQNKTSDLSSSVISRATKPTAKKFNVGSRLSQIVNNLKTNAVKSSPTVVTPSPPPVSTSGTVIARSPPISNYRAPAKNESVFKVPQKVVNQHEKNKSDKIISYIQKPVDIRTYFYVCGFQNCSFASLYSEQFRGHLVMCHSGLKCYPCPHCCHESNGEEELYRHLLTHSSSKQFILYKCSFDSCTYASNVINEFREHNMVHHADKHALTCYNCSAMFSTLDDLMKHVDGALLKFVQCVHCNVKSKSRRMILDHMKTEHPLKGRQISVASQLVCFKREMSQAKLAAGYTFIKIAADSSPVPKVELKQEPKPEPKQEALCLVKERPPAREEPLDFRMQSELSDPKLEESFEDSTDSAHLFKCTLCPYESKDAKRISNHKRVHLLPTSNKRFLCNYCPIGFDSYDRYVRHINIYPGVHTLTFYNCSQCSFMSNRESHIVTHMSIDHSITDKSYTTNTATIESEEYKCDLCPYTTRVLGQLTHHKQLHQKNPEDLEDPEEEVSSVKLDCRFCPKDFDTLTSLERHLATHPEAAGKLNAYRCINCCAMGTSVTALKNHWRTTHGMGPARIKRIRRNIRFPFCPAPGATTSSESGPTPEKVAKIESNEMSPPPVQNDVEPPQLLSEPIPHVSTYSRSSNRLYRDKNIDPDEIRYNGEPRITCFICQNTFKKWASLRVHMSKHPNREDFNAFQCISCKLRSTSFNYLVEHCVDIHGQSPNTKPRISDIVVKAGDSKDINTSPYSRINWRMNPPKHKMICVSAKRDLMKAGQCVVCKNDYERICGLMVHVQNTHPEIPEVMVYKCFTCRRRSTSKTFMNNHVIESHNGASTFKPIMLKVRRHADLPPIEPEPEELRQCPTCEFTTLNLAEHRFHMFNCDNSTEQEYDFGMPSEKNENGDDSDPNQSTKAVFDDYRKCQFCSFKTKIRTNMQRHMLWHESSDRLNPLKRLNYKTNGTPEMEGQEGTPPAPPPQKCQPEYKIIANNIVQCTLCDYASFNKTSVRKHFSNKHRKSLENRMRYDPSLEGIILSQSSYGKEEEYQAGKPSGRVTADNLTGEEMFRQVYHYRCKLCPDYWSPLYNTMMSHLDSQHTTMERNNYYSYYMYECRVCFKHLKKEDRDAHKSEHQLSLRCTYCDFSTGHRKALTSHMFSHFQYKRYRCQYCWHTTAFRSNIRLHVSRVHPEKPLRFDVKYDESVRRKVTSLIASIRMVTTTSPKLPKTDMPEDVVTKPKDESYVIKCVMCDHTSLTIDVMKLHYEKDHPGHQCKWKRRIQEMDANGESESSLTRGENDEYILCQPTPNKIASPRRHMNANDVCFPAGPLVANGQNDDGTFYKQCKICKAKFNAAGSSASYRHIYREHMPACYQCAYCEYRAYPSSTVNVHCRSKHPELRESYILVKDDAYKQFEYFYNKISMGMEVDYDASQDRKKTSHELDAFRSNGVMFPARVLCSRTPDGVGFQCRLCGAAFSSLSRLPYDHLYANHLPQCFKCPYCTYRAYPRSIVMKHVIKHHPGETKKTILVKDESFVEFTKLYEKLKETSDETLPLESPFDVGVDYKDEIPKPDFPKMDYPKVDFNKVDFHQTSPQDIAELYIEETASPDVDKMFSYGSLLNDTVAQRLNLGGAFVTNTKSNNQIDKIAERLNLTGAFVTDDHMPQNLPVNGGLDVHSNGSDRSALPHVNTNGPTTTNTNGPTTTNSNSDAADAPHVDLDDDFNADSNDGYLSEELASGYTSGDSAKISELSQARSESVNSDMDEAQRDSYHSMLHGQDVIGDMKLNDETPSETENGGYPSFDCIINRENEDVNENKRDASFDDDDDDEEPSPKKPHMDLSSTDFLFSCNVCSFTGMDLLSYEAHLATHDEFMYTVKKSVTSSTCGFCEVSMTNDEDFASHIAAHVAEHPNCCGYCDFVALDRSDVSAHIASCHPSYEEDILSADNNVVTKLDYVVSLQPELKLVDLADLDNFASDSEDG